MEDKNTKNYELSNLESKKIKKVETCAICKRPIVRDGQSCGVSISINAANICLFCAYAVEEAINMMDCMNEGLYDFDDFSDFNKMNPTKHRITVAKNDDGVTYCLPDKKESLDKVLKALKGHDKEISLIFRGIYRNLQLNVNELKNTFLLIAPSGEGKTETMKQIAKVLDVPFLCENAPDFSAAGYDGRDPDTMFFDLYKKCNGDLERAKRSIILIDEFDKLRHVNDHQKDVGGESVVNTLLGYVSGTEVPIRGEYNTILGYLDTSGITFIFAGAFEELDSTKSLYEIRDERLGVGKKVPIGFSGKAPKVAETEKIFLPQDIIDYGFSRQLVGRCSFIVEYKKSGLEVYKDVILNSTISTLKAYEKAFYDRGTKLVYNEKFVDEISTLAFSKNEGLRAIKNVVEKVLFLALEEVLDEYACKYSECILGNNIVNDPKNFILK